MADITQRLRLILEAQDNTKTAFEDVKKRGDDSLGDKPGGLGSLASKAKLAFGALAGAAAIGAVKAALDEVIRVGGEFETAMAKVGALSGANGASKDFQLLKEKAAELGREKMFTGAEVAGGMEALAMAGYDVNEILEAMPGLVDAAAAGQLDLKETADIISDVMGAMTLGADETDRVADILTKAFTTSNTTLGTLKETLKIAAPVANQAGMDLSTLAAAAGVLGDSGLKGSVAGTALRSMLVNLAAPTDKAADLIADLQIELKDVNGELLPLPDLIWEFNDKMKDMDPSEQTRLIKDLIGVEAMAGFNILLEAGPDKIRDYSKELKESLGTAARVAAEQTDTLEGSTGRLNSAMDGLKVAIFERVGPTLKSFNDDTLTPLINAITTFVEEIGEANVNNLVESNEILGNTIEEMQDPIAETITSVHELDKETGLLKATAEKNDKAMQLLGLAMQATNSAAVDATTSITTADIVFGKLDTSTTTSATGIKTASDNVVKAFEAIDGATDTTEKSFSDLKAESRKAKGAIWADALILKNTVTPKIDELGTTFEETATEVRDFGTDFTTVTDGVDTDAGKMAESLDVPLRGFSEGWTGFFVDEGPTLSQDMATLGDDMAGALTGALDTAIFTFLNDNFKVDWDAVWTGLKSSAASAISGLITEQLRQKVGAQLLSLGTSASSNFSAGFTTDNAQSNAFITAGSAAGSQFGNGLETAAALAATESFGEGGTVVTAAQESTAAASAGWFAVGAAIFAYIWQDFSARWNDHILKLAEDSTSILTATTGGGGDDGVNIVEGVVDSSAGRGSVGSGGGSGQTAQPTYASLSAAGKRAYDDIERMYNSGLVSIGLFGRANTRFGVEEAVDAFGPGIVQRIRDALLTLADGHAPRGEEYDALQSQGIGIRARHGYEGIVDRPTLTLMGEAGAERVSVKPMGGGGFQGGAGNVNNFTFNVHAIDSQDVEEMLKTRGRQAIRDILFEDSANGIGLVYSDGVIDPANV